MRKLPKAAAAAAILGIFSLIGTGTASAQGMDGSHGGGCKSHDMNIDILGQVGVLNGLLGNALNGEGNPGAQVAPVGSHCEGGW
ncbi:MULTISPECIES: hypothetical protein [unclassified Streptomyces]|uniref:hypothetical protein n=1 Tax=unclassified Streptomyces TaxID=2593676 RepID=UPI002254F809|nr:MULTISPECIES: hypothetical protein [unclassified Streptomyces]MCX4881992.1 hypothetical protein [Streptomyces sp. NBC_00847]MCX5049371.1 hypothetical protein [Streptomyces sp. NBC_00474]MCX5055868.1 hypothetical protein [Streptomyces sp. NBC_00452]MCX5247276.1 hypothetical protein [Streptomyces sp. NBC_00201]MCX5286962.1 hypothetical protein [Streptomyces sp. NBC_00183]